MSWPWKTQTRRRVCGSARTNILIPCVIGGDHAITIPILRAFDCYRDLCVIHFDAHLDFSKNPHGIAEGPGSPMRRAS